MIAMLRAAWRAFVLKPLPMQGYDYSPVYSVLAVSLTAFLSAVNETQAGLEAAAQRGVPAAALAEHASLLPYFTATELAASWGATLMIWLVMYGWLRVGGRWNGEGSLFNLIAASSIVIEVIAIALTALGLPAKVVLVLLLYSVWVLANAVAGAMPQVARKYALVGALLSLLPAMVVAVLAMGVAGSMMQNMAG